MRLTVQTDYALRMLMHLSVHEEELVTIGAIAERFNISKNHLMKVAQSLGAAGILNSVRGRHGGLLLGRAADEITLGEVARRLEKDSAIVECFAADGGDCLISPCCRLKNILAEAQEALFSVLDQYTVRDLTLRNPRLKSLLTGEAA